MAETELTVERVSDPASPSNPTLQDVDSVNGNKFLNSGKTRVYFIGASGATGTVTITPQTNCTCANTSQHAQASIANDLDAATKWVQFGRLPPPQYNDSDGYAIIGYTGTVTNVKVMVCEESEI